jgi:flagellar basal body-associated protein FliL
MKKYIKASIALIFTIVTCIFGGMNAFAWVAADGIIVVRYTDAPEGTVFADILLPKNENDKYASADGKPSAAIILHGEDENGERTEETLTLAEDCELAKYDDGYTSCLFGRDIATEYRVNSFRMDIVLDEEKLINTDVSNYYGSLKLAYCDENGNVLAVTDPVETEHTDKPANFYVNADGTSLECKLDHGIDVGKGLTAFIFGTVIVVCILAVLGVAVIAAIVVVVVILILRHNKKKNQQQYRR